MFTDFSVGELPNALFAHPPARPKSPPRPPTPPPLPPPPTDYIPWEVREAERLAEEAALAEEIRAAEEEEQRLIKAVEEEEQARLKEEKRLRKEAKKLKKKQKQKEAEDAKAREDAEPKDSKDLEEPQDPDDATSSHGLKPPKTPATPEDSKSPKGAKTPKTPKTPKSPQDSKVQMEVTAQTDEEKQKAAEEKQRVEEEKQKAIAEAKAAAEAEKEAKRLKREQDREKEKERRREKKERREKEKEYLRKKEEEEKEYKEKEKEREEEAAEKRRAAGPYKANAARRELQPKTNTGEAAQKAAAEKALAGITRKAASSMTSVNLAAFPMPGQDPTANVGRPPSIISNDGSEFSYRPESLVLLNSKSASQLTNFNERAGSVRAPSIRSGISQHSKYSNHPRFVGSLGEEIGFTFKATCNFVHPGRQLPRAMTRSRQPSALSVLLLEDEDEDEMAERMNSVTSDGGWKSGWSVAGSNQGDSGPFSGYDDDFAEDLAPEDTIFEEGEDGLDPPRSMSLNYANPRRSLRRKASLSMRFRGPKSNDDVDPMENASDPTSPVRQSFGRALEMLSRNVEDDEEMSREEKIAAARLAFEQREADKDRKWAEYEARREVKRRNSELQTLTRRPSWFRKPSNAVDSAAASLEEQLPKPAPPPLASLQGGIISGGFVASFNTVGGNTGRVRNFRQKRVVPVKHEDPDSLDPFSAGPPDADDSQPQRSRSASSAMDFKFPAYNESRTDGVDHSMFSAKWQDDVPPVPEHLLTERSQSMAAAIPEAEPEPAAPAPTYYFIDGQAYDEYGELVDISEQQQKQLARRLSVAKQARGQINKFSAWGKTRMLRV